MSRLPCLRVTSFIWASPYFESILVQARHPHVSMLSVRHRLLESESHVSTWLVRRPRDVEPAK